MAEALGAQPHRVSPMGCPSPCSQVVSEGLGEAVVDVGAIPCSLPHQARGAGEELAAVLSPPCSLPAPLLPPNHPPALGSSRHRQSWGGLCTLYLQTRVHSAAASARPACSCTRVCTDTRTHTCAHTDTHVQGSAAVVPLPQLGQAPAPAPRLRGGNLQLMGMLRCREGLLCPPSPGLLPKLGTAREQPRLPREWAGIGGGRALCPLVPLSAEAAAGGRGRPQQLWSLGGPCGLGGVPVSLGGPCECEGVPVGLGGPCELGRSL